MLSLLLLLLWLLFQELNFFRKVDISFLLLWLAMLCSFSWAHFLKYPFSGAFLYFLSCPRVNATCHYISNEYKIHFLLFSLFSPNDSFLRFRANTLYKDLLPIFAALVRIILLGTHYNTRNYALLSLFLKKTLSVFFSGVTITTVHFSPFFGRFIKYIPFILVAE